MPGIEVLPDADTLAARAVEHFIRLAMEATRDHRRFRVALAGGATPKKMYVRLGGETLDWQNIFFFWGDERCVPPDHVDSNYRMATDVLLERIPIPPGNIHRIHGELSPQEAAQDYEIELQNEFKGNLPRFDLVLLGLGNDGHTASLFPGTPALLEPDRWVAEVHHATPPPPLVDRVTVTLRVINAAAHVIFLVSGADKVEILRRVLHGTPQPGMLPAQWVKPAAGSLHWLLDRSAAGGKDSKVIPD